MPRRAHPDVRTGRLRAADPFELIRWLARSQTDPRKALAELVQNSLDAQARTVTITRLRERGVTALRMHDDGEGVIPEMERDEALAYVATHIGHSRKRNLTPEERRELLLQGQYGIGLLGFWSIGAELEMRTQIAGGEPWALRLWEDRPNFEVAPVGGRLRLEGTWTELIVRSLHRPALVSLTARRIGDYLAAELRGQLLGRDVAITVHDRMGRGRAQKVRRVEPVRFAGERIALPETLPVAEHGVLRAELYLAPPGGEPGHITLACGGTVVYDDLTQALDGRFASAPWNDGRLLGLIDFDGFAVAPGSRRGVLLDEAAEAFSRVIDTALAPAVRALLEEDERRRAAAVEADLVQKLERAFRDLAHEAPEYDFFAVRGGGRRVQDAPSPNGTAVTAEPAAAPADKADDEAAAFLLAPGPLECVEIVPARARVERGDERRLRARARDANGVRVRDIACTWTLLEGPGRLAASERLEAIFHARDETGTARIRLTAAQDGREATAEASIEVVDELRDARSRAGIPEPAFVSDARGDWRSRLADGHWEVNAAHRDYTAAVMSPRRKLRYLAALLAKEIVLHSYPLPQGGMLLERLVSVLAITERGLDRT